MASLYNAKANAARFADQGMDIMIAGDQTENIIMPSDVNRVAPLRGNKDTKR
jgi:hypothetical protein